MKLNRRQNETLWTFKNIKIQVKVSALPINGAKDAIISKGKNVFVFVVGHYVVLIVMLQNG